jgi:type 1 glutamine amidotransferase
MHVDALKLGVGCPQCESGLFIAVVGHSPDLLWSEQAVKETIRRCINWAANEADLVASEAIELAEALRARLDE